jgi:DNA processing protein
MKTFMEKEKQSRAAWRLLPGIGSQRLRLMIAHFGSAEAAWQAQPEEYLQWGKAPWALKILAGRKKIDQAQVMEDLDRQGISLVIPEEDNYPHLLAELVDAPPLLYYKGKLRPAKEALAIVGSRRATAYGRAAAEYLAQEAAARGIVVISGLARGIDTAAHRGALAVKGETWAFLGNGLDRVYPPENQQLAQNIMENGALLSEFIPGSAPEAHHFPARNRLISGCARGVIVVEAARQSGSLITVDFALEQGREVFAVPGPIFSEMSRGTHHLLRSGARIAEGLEDIQAEIPLWREPELSLRPLADSRQSGGRKSDPESGGEKHSCPVAPESAECREIMDLLSDVPLHIDQIALQSAQIAGSVALTLLELQLSGKIEQLPGQYYILARRP